MQFIPSSLLVITYISQPYYINISYCMEQGQSIVQKLYTVVLLLYVRRNFTPVDRKQDRRNVFLLSLFIHILYILILREKIHFQGRQLSKLLPPLLPLLKRVLEQILPFKSRPLCRRGLGPDQQTGSHKDKFSLCIQTL